MARILLIDDDVPFRTMLGETLTHVGHRVLEASDGREGLALFGSTDPDLVITDLVMPETEGFEVLAALKKGKRHVPVIVITGGGRNQGDYLRMAGLLGAGAVLGKPFPIADLIAAISEVLGEGTTT